LTSKGDETARPPRRAEEGHDLRLAISNKNDVLGRVAGLRTETSDVLGGAARAGSANVASLVRERFVVTKSRPEVRPAAVQGYCNDRVAERGEVAAADLGRALDVEPNKFTGTFERREG
jgi:hypothetical protein